MSLLKAKDPPKKYQNTKKTSTDAMAQLYVYGNKTLVKERYFHARKQCVQLLHAFNFFTLHPMSSEDKYDAVFTSRMY